MAAINNMNRLRNEAVDNPEIATMLRVFGIDHRRFNVKFQGLNFGLSGVGSPQVLRDILA